MDRAPGAAIPGTRVPGTGLLGMSDIGRMSRENARETLKPKAVKPFALALSSQGKAPDWVMLLPPGRIDTNDGRSFVNDQPEVVVAKFNSGNLLLPFDFEHGSEIKSPTGEFAPAAGWIVEVENRDGAIWAKVDWTERGRAAIEAKEVRYVSPAFLFDYSTGRVEALSSAALTVRPAISSLPAIASRQSQQEETEMKDRKALCQRLKLAETATDEQILAAIDKLESDKALALASAQVPDLTKYVPRADYDAVVTDRDGLRAANASREATDLQTEGAALVEQGIKDAKIAPASKDFYLSTCATKAGLDQLKAFLTSAPKVVPGKIGEDEPGKTGKALTTTQKQVARELGISEEDFAKQLAADAAETQEA